MIWIPIISFLVYEVCSVVMLIWIPVISFLFMRCSVLMMIWIPSVPYPMFGYICK